MEKSLDRSLTKQCFETRRLDIFQICQSYQNKPKISSENRLVKVDYKNAHQGAGLKLGANFTGSREAVSQDAQDNF